MCLLGTDSSTGYPSLRWHRRSTSSEQPRSPTAGSSSLGTALGISATDFTQLSNLMADDSCLWLRKLPGLAATHLQTRACAALRQSKVSTSTNVKRCCSSLGKSEMFLINTWRA